MIRTNGTPQALDSLPAAGSRSACEVAGLTFDRLGEAEIVDHVISAALRGSGGWVATPNVDICRLATRHRDLANLLSSASLMVPDGMPLVWATRLRGDPLPERVTGSSLIYSLTKAAAQHDQSIYLLGGAPGVAQQAAEVLGKRYPGLVVAGTDAPVLGVPGQPDDVSAIRDRIAAAQPDIVFVGLGFPKQERLIAQLAPDFPSTWFICCGAAITFAAGAQRRAPDWMQRSGLEWAYRLFREPRRLVRRYLIEDLPFAAALLIWSAATPCRVGPYVPHRDDGLILPSQRYPSDPRAG